MLECLIEVEVRLTIVIYSLWRIAKAMEWIWQHPRRSLPIANNDSILLRTVMAVDGRRWPSLLKLNLDLHLEAQDGWQSMVVIASAKSGSINKGLEWLVEGEARPTIVSHSCLNLHGNLRGYQNTDTA